MSRWFTMLLFLVGAFLPVSLNAFDWAVTAGPITIFPSEKTFPAGFYAQVGFRAVLTPRIEAELIAIPQITPGPMSTAAAGALVGINILDGEEPAYFNIIADIGVIAMITPGENQYDPLVYLRISPLVIGNPSYWYRGRLFTVGAVYDIPNRQLSWTFSTWIQNWFPGRH